MAFDRNNLSVTGFARSGYPGADGHTAWFYRSPWDPMSEIEAPDYFNDAADLLRVGDPLVINALAEADPDARPHQDALAFVKSRDGGVVRIAVACRA